MSIQPDVVPQSVRARRYLWGLAIALAVACMVAVGEINAQSGRLVDDQGRAWPLSVLVGPGWIERSRGWPEVLTSLIGDPLYRALLSWFLAINAIFVVCYAAVLAGLIAALFRTNLARIAIWTLAGVVVLSDLVENLCILVLLVSGSPAGPLSLLWWCTTVKWFGLGAVIAVLLLRFVVPQSTRDGHDESNSPKQVVLRIVRALMHHRFSVAIVIPLAVLTMLSGSAILEQLPDVQRQWVSNGAQGWGQAAWAVAVLLGVGFLLEILGRFRTRFAERNPVRPRDPDAETKAGAAPRDPSVVPQQIQPKPWLGPLRRRLWEDLKLIGTMAVELFTNRRQLTARLRHLAAKQDAQLGLWVLGIVIPLGAALLAWIFLPPTYLLVTRLLVFCAVPVVIVVASWILRRAWQIRDDWYIPYEPPEFTDREVSLIGFVGRALALTAVTVAGIGLIRSFLSVVVLGPSLTGVSTGSSAFFLVLGIAGVMLPWAISWFVVVRRVSDPMSEVGRNAPVRLGKRWALLGIVLVFFLGIAVFPRYFAAMGVSAVTITSLALLIGIAASAGLLIQDRPNAEIFRFLGLRRTPLVSVLVIAIVLAGLTVGGSTIHQVASTPATERVSDRPPIGNIVSPWLDQPGACEVTVPVNGRDQRVRPMIMIAAEGGGIRAAYWTVKGLAALDENTGGCGAQSVLFSGGASGGSVGLTVARFSGTPSDPGTERAVRAVEAMAKPDTLSQAVIGTFVRDPLYGATGVPLGSFGAAPAGTWADRARLIELGWDRAAVGQAWGTQPFLSDGASLSPATGPLVLNSSSVGSQCRVWVSQLDLEQAAASDGEQQCDHQVSPGARTVDLFAAYGPVGGSGDDCLGTVNASTATLLTARFPYVTPGGVVGSCNVDGARSEPGFWPRTQLIDGGYIENTGLATITDLSTQWLAQVRSHNEDVVAGRSDQPVIVPFVVFLTNEQATAGRLTQPPALQSELLLPAVGYLRGSATLTRTDALLQRVSTTVRTRSICPPAQPNQLDCDAIVDEFPRRVIVVDRTAQPEVTAPLGWVLSKASMTGLDEAMTHQVQSTCAAGSNEPACLRGYGALGDLLGYLKR